MICPNCGLVNTTSFDFIKPRTYCYNCNRVTDDMILKTGRLYNIYYFFKHLYYRYIHRP